jgi:hypothetical protein
VTNRDGLTARLVAERNVALIVRERDAGLPWESSTGPSVQSRLDEAAHYPWKSIKPIRDAYREATRRR